jgi:hypothetical protein
MNWKQKAGIAALVILIIAILAFIIKQQRDIIEQQRYAEKSVVEMKQLQNDLVRAQAAYATRKDVEKAIKDAGVDLSTVEDDLDKLGSEVKGVVTLLSATPGYHGNDLPSTGTTPGPATEPPKVECPDGTTVNCPNPDQHGYLGKRQWLQLEEPFSDTKKVPWGRAGFSAWKKDPWDLEVYPRKYSAVTVLSMDEEGRHFAHSKMSVEVNGERVAVPISESKLVEVLPEREFRFVPRLYLGMDGGIKANPPAHAEFIPNLQLSLFSYGMTTANPEWTFLGLGLGYEIVEEGIALIVSPVNYNVGKHLPFVDNVYVGPSISIDPASNLSILLGIHVGL